MKFFFSVSLFLSFIIGNHASAALVKLATCEIKPSGEKIDLFLRTAKSGPYTSVRFYLEYVAERGQKNIEVVSAKLSQNKVKELMSEFSKGNLPSAADSTWFDYHNPELVNEGHFLMYHLRMSLDFPGKKIFLQDLTTPSIERYANKILHIEGPEGTYTSQGNGTGDSSFNEDHMLHLENCQFP